MLQRFVRGKIEIMIFAGLFLLLANHEQALIARVAASGRVLEIGVSSSERMARRPQIAPGAAPLLSFRFFEGIERHRFGALHLVIDDAGH